MSTRFCFAIPLRSRAASQSWPRVEALLAGTLTSILAQTDPEFDVLIACHERPDLPQLSDPRITVLSCEAPTPTTFKEQMLDKRLKRKMMGVEFARRGGGYFMPLDSDDLVSNRLAAYARERASPTGYLIDKGVVYDQPKGSVQVKEAFDQTCGSCAVFALAPDDLPATLDDNRACFFNALDSHKQFAELAEAHGRPLEPVPFPAVIYVIGTGENWTILSGGVPLYSTSLQTAKRLANRLLRRRQPTPALRREFAGLAA